MTADGRKKKRGQKAKPKPVVLVSSEPKDDEELQLEAALFGTVDTNDGTQDADQAPNKQRKQKKRKVEEVDAAWHDSDDEKLKISIDTNQRKKLRHNLKEKQVTGVEYQQRLREQHARLSRVDDKWAKQDEPIDSSDSEGEKDDTIRNVLQSTASLTAKSDGLAASVIDLQRLTNANVQAVSKCVVQVCAFHPDPTTNLLMTAGLDKHIRVFRVNGKTNPLVHATYLRELPIFHAAFSPSGNCVWASGRRSVIYQLDLEQGAVTRYNPLTEDNFGQTKFAVDANGGMLAFSGRDSSVHFVDTRSHQRAFTVQGRAQIAALDFAPTHPMHLVTAGSEGLVHIFDVRTRRCLNICQDEGSLNTTQLTFSSDGNLTTGSTSGVVNVYKYSSFLESDRPKPTKAIMNLTTRISSIACHPQGELYSFASSEKKGAIRLLHVPTFTVFRNWPLPKNPLRYITSTAFSPRGAYMCLGDDKGQVLLYRLKHYSRKQ